MIARAFGLVALAAVAACSDSSPRDGATAAAVPPGWQKIVALAGGGGRPRVSAALPGDIDRTDEAGIDSEMANYRGPRLSVRFDYGAAAHPGCPAGVRRCALSDTEIAGRPARMSVAEAGEADRPFRSVHAYFVPLGQGASPGRNASGGSGLLLIVKCAEAPACSDAARIASTIRLEEAR